MQLMPDNKVLIITHKDLDGVGSLIIAGHYFNLENMSIVSIKYSEADEVILRIEPNNFDTIIVSDVSPSDINILDRFGDKLIFLDHHDTSVSYHNPNKNRIIDITKCATLVTKEFFENKYNKKFPEIDELCNLINDYDMWILKDPRSWELNELFFYYWEVKFRNRFFNGNLTLNPDETKFLKDRRKYFNDLWDKLKVFDIPDIKGCYCEGEEMINDICHKLLTQEGYDFVFCRNRRTKTVSIRSTRNDIHIGKLLKSMNLGGGHQKAGGTIVITNYSDLEPIIFDITNKIKSQIFIKNI